MALWETIIAAEIIAKVAGIGSYLATASGAGNSSVLVVGVFLLSRQMRDVRADSLRGRGLILP